MNAKLHPLDFGALTKGSWLETEQLEEALLCKRDEPGFQQRLLGLREMIEDQTGILSREEGQRLRLMTDSEAQIWCVKQAGLGARRIQRAADRLQNRIDVAQLSPAEQAVHEHASRVLTEMATSQLEQVKRNQRLFALMGRPGALPEGDDED